MISFSGTCFGLAAVTVGTSLALAAVNEFGQAATRQHFATVGKYFVTNTTNANSINEMQTNLFLSLCHP